MATVTVTAAGETATATYTVGSGPLAGWFRTAGNTGLAAVGVTAAMLTPLTPIADLTVTTRLYRQKIMLGGNQLILGTGGVLEQCQISSTRIAGQGCIRLVGSGQQILNCDLLIGSDTSGESMGIFADALDGVTIRSLRQTGGSMGMWLDGDATGKPSIVDAWWLSAMVGGQAHHDGWTRRSGTAPITITNSRISMADTYVTAAVFFQNTYGPPGGLTLTNCLLEGSGYCLQLDETVSASCTNNRFASTGWGPTEVNTRIPSFAWANNYVYAAPGPDGIGALLSNPNP